jgi:hypothetical protein
MMKAVRKALTSYFAFEPKLKEIVRLLSMAKMPHDIAART